MHAFQRSPCSTAGARGAVVQRRAAKGCGAKHTACGPLRQATDRLPRKSDSAPCGAACRAGPLAPGAGKARGEGGGGSRMRAALLLAPALGAACALGLRGARGCPTKGWWWLKYRGTERACRGRSAYHERGPAHDSRWQRAMRGRGGQSPRTPRQEQASRCPTDSKADAQGALRKARDKGGGRGGQGRGPHTRSRPELARPQACNSAAAAAGSQRPLLCLCRQLFEARDGAPAVGA